MSLIITRLQKDIEDMIGVCKRCMVLNLKKTVSDDQKNEQDWILMKQNIRNEAIKVQAQLQSSSKESGTDGYYLISKMLNMRDNLQCQIF